MAQKTFSGVLGDSKCECADWNCPAHKGHSDCREVATSILYRVDMQDETGTAFCDACADDAMESGLFTDSLDDDDDDEDDDNAVARGEIREWTIHCEYSGMTFTYLGPEPVTCPECGSVNIEVIGAETR